MRRIFAGLAFLVAGGFTAHAADAPALNFSSGTCRQDGEIAADKRQAVEASAMAFVQALLDSKPDLAARMMIQAAQDKGSAASGAIQISAYLNKTGPYRDPKIAHTYLLETSGNGPDTTTVCGIVSGTDWAAMAVTPGTTQAHVVISAKTVNNDWAFVLWLVHEGDVWHVRDIEVTPSTIVGRSADDLLKLARQQRDRGNMLNAQLLYTAAEYVSNRGRAFQLGIAQALKEDLAKFKRPSELAGSSPFSWTLNDAAFKVSRVGPIGVAGQIGLTFDLPSEHWTDDKDAERRNRAFLDAFRAAHPEYSQVFGFLVARAIKPDNSGGFSTVYDSQRGYR